MDADVTMFSSRLGDRMTFYYTKDFHVDHRGVLSTVMRPRIPIRISNLRPARQGGSDFGYTDDALADSGADTTFIAREVADAINIDFDASMVTSMVTPFGEFEVYHTFVRIEVLYKGQRIDLGKIPARVPEKDMATLGNRPFVVAGRSKIFSQYSMKFDDYKQVLVLERTGPGADPHK